MAVVWDDKNAVMVPGKQMVTLGTVVNFERKNVDAIDPVDNYLKRQSTFQFATNMTVADLRGGGRLPGRLR